MWQRKVRLHFAGTFCYVLLDVSCSQVEVTLSHIVLFLKCGFCIVVEMLSELLLVFGK